MMPWEKYAPAAAASDAGPWAKYAAPTGMTREDIVGTPEQGGVSGRPQKTAPGAEIAGFPTTNVGGQQMLRTPGPGEFLGGLADRFGASSLGSGYGIPPLFPGIGEIGGAGAARAAAKPVTDTVGRVLGAPARAATKVKDALTYGKTDKAAEALGKVTTGVQDTARTQLGQEAGGFEARAKQAETEAAAFEEQAKKLSAEANAAGTAGERFAAQGRAASARVQQHAASLGPVVKEEDAGKLIQNAAKDNRKALSTQRNREAIQGAKNPAWARAAEREKRGELPSSVPASAKKLQEAADLLKKQTSKILPGLGESPAKKNELLDALNGPVTLEQLETGRRILRDPMARGNVEGLKAMSAIDAGKLADKLEEAMRAYDPSIGAYLDRYRALSDKMDRALGSTRATSATREVASDLFNQKPAQVVSAYMDGTRASAQDLLRLVGGKSPELEQAVNGVVRGKLESMDAKAAQEWLSKNRPMLETLSPKAATTAREFVRAKQEVERLEEFSTFAGKSAQASTKAAENTRGEMTGKIKAGEAAKVEAVRRRELSDAVQRTQDQIKRAAPNEIPGLVKSNIETLARQKLISQEQARQYLAQADEITRKYQQTAGYRKQMDNFIKAALISSVGYSGYQTYKGLSSH